MAVVRIGVAIEYGGKQRAHGIGLAELIGQLPVVIKGTGRAKNPGSDGVQQGLIVVIQAEPTFHPFTRRAQARVAGFGAIANEHPVGGKLHLLQAGIGPVHAIKINVVVTGKILGEFHPPGVQFQCVARVGNARAVEAPADNGRGDVIHKPALAQLHLLAAQAHAHGVAQGVPRLDVGLIERDRASTRAIGPGDEIAAEVRAPYLETFEFHEGANVIGKIRLHLKPRALLHVGQIVTRVIEIEAAVQAEGSERAIGEAETAVTRRCRAIDRIRIVVVPVAAPDPDLPPNLHRLQFRDRPAADNKGNYRTPEGFHDLVHSNEFPSRRIACLPFKHAC